MLLYRNVTNAGKFEVIEVKVIGFLLFSGGVIRASRIRDVLKMKDGQVKHPQ